MQTRIRTYPQFNSGSSPTGKFLQLELDGIPWLLFADAAALRYHNEILAAFLDERGVAHRWTGPELLEYDHERVLVSGGGRFALDMNSATLVLWDKSGAYGRFQESRIRSEMAAASAPWAGLEVRVRD